MCWTRAGNFSNGVSKSNPCAYAPSSKVRFRIADPEPGPKPPSKSGRDQSLMIFDGSKSYFEPSPLHAGQAPYGELKLNERGSSTGTEIPHSGHASFSENVCSFPPTTATVTSPLASFSAVAMDCSRRAAIRAMRHAHRGVDHAQIVVNLCDRPDRRPRRPRGGFLFDGDRRRKPFNHVHFGTFHLIEKLSGVCGQRFHIAALPFRVNSVKGERRFSRAGKPGDDRQGVPGNLDADVFQVMLSRAPDYQFGQAHETIAPLRRSLPAPACGRQGMQALTLSSYTEPTITSQDNRS